MRHTIGSFWRFINEREQPREEDQVDVRGYPLCRLFHEYFWKPHAPSILLIVTICSVLGLAPYSYTAAGKFIADDIVEISLVAQENTATTDLDPTLPGEERLFAAPDPHERTSWDERHEQRVGKSNRRKMQLLAYLAIALVVMEIARHGLDFIARERIVYVTQKAQFRLRRHLHDKLHALSMAYHDRHSSGRLMTYLFSDMMVVQNQVTMMLQGAPRDVFAIIGGAFIVLYLNPPMGLLVLACMPAYCVIHRWFGKRLKTLNRSLREDEGRLNGHIANRVNSVHVVKSFGRESHEVASFLDRTRALLMRNLGIGMLNTTFVALCGIISGACTTAVLWMGALRVRDGSMTAGEAIMFYAAAGHLFSPVASMVNRAGAFHRLRAVASKIMHVLDEPITLKDCEHPLTPPADAPAITFQNVCLTYEHATIPALSDISFTFPAGKRLCVMGSSGSGKTTLAKLCARLYDPTEGTIKLDDVDLRQLRIPDLRKLIGFVGQEPVIFAGTIHENIRYGSQSSTMRDVVAAAQFAQAHEFITRMPERYQTLTQERGLTLSGGQKQRVNLARALMSETPVLILDDCTSALDAATEARLIESFRTVLADRTCILTTHRTSIAVECDYVLILSAGRLIEFGPPRELLQADGPFAAIVREQTDKIESATGDLALAETEGTVSS